MSRRSPTGVAEDPAGEAGRAASAPGSPTKRRSSPHRRGPPGRAVAVVGDVRGDAHVQGTQGNLPRPPPSRRRSASQSTPSVIPPNQRPPLVSERPPRYPLLRTRTEGVPARDAPSRRLVRSQPRTQVGSRHGVRRYDIRRCRAHGGVRAAASPPPPRVDPAVRSGRRRFAWRRCGRLLRRNRCSRFIAAAAPRGVREDAPPPDGGLTPRCDPPGPSVRGRRG